MRASDHRARGTRNLRENADPAVPEAGGGHIEITGLGHTYRNRKGGRTTALGGVDLSIFAGEFVSIVGPSGCGKTSLLRIAAGLVQATSGSLRLDGVEVRRPQKKVGMVFQQPTLLPWRTVLSNVLLPAELAGSDINAAKVRAMDLLEMVDLADFSGAYPHELSGGMQQRVGICRALVNDPEVLLMDEPFAALDALSRDRMGVELQRIWMTSRKTVVFITHSINEAVFLADRVAVMTPRPGRIAETIEVPFERPRDLSLLSSDRIGPLVTRVRRHFEVTGRDR